jgi:hypothetical protein
MPGGAGMTIGKNVGRAYKSPRLPRLLQRQVHFCRQRQPQPGARGSPPAFSESSTAVSEIHFDEKLIRKDSQFIPKDLQSLNPESFKD